MNSRPCPAPCGRTVLLAALLLVAGFGPATAGSITLLPEIDERGGHIGYTLARHYSLLIPGRETRLFGGAVFSYTRDVDATLHDLGAGAVLIQNLAGDRITGRFQLDLGTRVQAVHRLPSGRDAAAGGSGASVPEGFFLENEAYPLTAAEMELRFTAADSYHFPERAIGARAGAGVALGVTGEPYSTVHLTGSLQAVIPVFTPLVQVDLGARYRGYLNPGWLDGPAPASALSHVDLRGYTGTERRAHGASVSAALAVRLPFEFYVPMSAGGGAYFDAGRVSGHPAALVRLGAADEAGGAAGGIDRDGAAVAGGFIEYRALAPFGMGSVTLSGGMGAIVSEWTSADPWVRLAYRTGWFFSDPL